MATQIGQLGVTFPDTTVQTTAAIAGAPGFGGFTRMSVYTTTSFWIVPAGVTTCKVTVVGGGGGGGANGNYAGSGGGGGGTAIKIITGLTPGTSITVTVGAGGLNGYTAGGTSGLAGGASSFGSYCSATGGGGGQNNSGGAGGGGNGVSGNINFPGGGGSPQFAHEIPGESQSIYYTMGSAGGGSYVAPGNSSGYGAGGGSQGNGYAGVVIVEY